MHLCRYCVGQGQLTANYDHELPSEKPCPACKGKGEVEGLGVRECFVAPTGWVLLDIDYNMAELRALAQIERWWFGSSALGDVLNDPKRDCHVEIAAAAKGMSVEAAYALKRTDPKAFKDLRQSGKAISFGTPGGMGGARLADYSTEAYGVPMTEEQGKAILAMVKRVYPERAAYLGRIGAWCEATNRRYRFTAPYSGRVRGGLGYSTGANSPFQGLTSDFFKEALWRVAVHEYVLVDSALYGARTVNAIHDQLLVEAPESRYREAAKELQRQVVGAAQEICPDIQILAEPAACRRWSKAGGDAVYDSAGQLAIYEDTLSA